MGIASLVIGIISMILGCVPFCNVIMLVPVVVGIILGIIGIAINQQRGIAIAGLITCIIAIIVICIVSATFTNTINTTSNEITTEYIEESESDFKNSCVTHTYEELARNPNDFKGSKIKLTGEIIQTMYDGNKVEMRINITKTGEYYTYYEDTIYVTYTMKDGESKLLENDIITLWGIADGEYQYTSVLGSRITLPIINAKYIDMTK